MSVGFRKSALHLKMRVKWRRKKMVYWKMVRCKITYRELVSPPGSIHLKLSATFGEDA